MNPRRIRTKNICVFSILTNNESANNYGILREIANKLGFSLIFTDKISDLNTNRCKALLIKSDDNFKLLSSEVKMIIDYLVGGGALIILLDSVLECELRSNIIELTDILGVYPRCSTLRGGDKNQVVEIIYLDEFKSSIVSETKELYYPRGASLIVKKRPFTKVFLRANLSEKNAKPPIIVFTRYGNGKAIIVGSRDLFIDSALRIENNFRVVLSILSVILGIEISKDKVDELLGIIKKEKKVPKKEVIEVLSTKIELPKTEEMIKKSQIIKEEAKKEVSEVAVTKQLMDRVIKLEELVMNLITKLTNLEDLVESIRSKTDEIYVKLNNHDKKVTKDIKKIHEVFKNKIEDSGS